MVIACVGGGSNAIGEGIKQAKRLSKNKIIVINLFGRGDKDIDYIYKYVE